MSAKAPGTLHIVDLLLDAVFMVDVHGRIVYVSAACERIFGYTPEEMTGKSLIDLIVPEDRARTLDEAQQVMAGKPRVGFENCYIRKDGRVVHIMWSARWSEADQLRIGVARDITECKRAEDMQAATYAIAEAAHSAADLSTMLREIHHIIARLVPAASFAVVLRDSNTGALSIPYRMEPSGSTTHDHDATLRRLYGEVLRVRQTIVESDNESSPGRRATWIALPLLSSKGITGALMLNSHPGTTHSEKDKDLLQFVSTQVATAIERRRLNDELLRAALRRTDGAAQQALVP